MATIAIPHIGLPSHLRAAVRLGGVLARQGHRVISWAPAAWRQEIEASGAEFRVDHAAAGQLRSQTPQGMTAAIAEHAVEAVPALIEGLLAEEVDLVVHDFHVLSARVAADFLGLPRIVSDPTYPGAGRQFAPFDPLAPWLVAIPGLAEGIDHAVARVAACRDALGRRWGIDIGDWRTANASRGEFTVSHTTEEIVGEVSDRTPRTYVGPLLPHQAHQASNVADTAGAGAGPLVFASLGTSFNFSAASFRLLLDALADEPLDAVLTMGGGILDASALGPAPANVSVVDYVAEPRPLLARADAFITHAGTASLHEALVAGTPMVCLPQGVDQPQWARRVQALGAGLVAEPHPEAIRGALNEVLSDDRYRARAAEVGERLAAHPGAELLSDLVDRALGRAPATPRPPRPAGGTGGDRRTRQAHTTVAMLHIGFHGHLTPAARIGRALVDHGGYRVLAWAPEAFRGQIEATGAEFVRHDAFPLRAHLSSPQTMAGALAEHAVEFVPELVERLRAESVDVVIHDYHVLWARVAGDFLALPRIASNPLFPFLEHELSPWDPLDPVLAERPGVRPALADALARVARASERLALQWGTELGGWREALISPAETTVRFTTEAICGVPPAAGEVYAGPLCAPIPGRAGGERPLVLASLGTAFNFSAPLYATLIDALGRVNADAVLGLGVGPIRGDALGTPPRNVEIRHDIDQPALLARCAAFVTHAGTSSVHEALLAGVPMVCLPQGADQWRWANRVRELGAGVAVAPDADAVARGVETVLGDPNFAARAAALGRELSVYPGTTLAVEAVQRALPAPSSPRSR